MMNWLLVLAGGALGAGLRYGASQLLAGPVATLVVNVLGCLGIGVLAGYGVHLGTLGTNFRLFLLVGVLGGFTTFSAFALNTLLLLERGELLTAGLYVAASVGLSFLAVFAGLWLVKAVA